MQRNRVHPRIFCSFDGCDRLQAAKFLCQTHYMQQRRGVELSPIRHKIRNHEYSDCPFPTCDKKRLLKPLCNNHMILANKYSITPDDYLALYENAKCHTCGAEHTAEARLNMDHDHACCSGEGKTCGKCFRGLLCHRCNITLGYVEDQPALLRALADYLENF